MSAQKSKNDTAWEALFTEHNILDDIEANGIHRITASAINKKREARLMTKFDHHINLPKIFSHNKLAILPDSRSSYVIGRFNCYESIPEEFKDDILERAFPDWMKSLSSTNLYSESATILCAYHAGLIREVLDEEVAFTVFGRMSTGKFDFSIQLMNEKAPLNQFLTVDRAQCEIDGGFESLESFAVLEVKNEEVTDFHIRQLYYPYRLWATKLTKRVIPIFLTYSNEIFTFSVYDFERPNDYNSLKLLKRKRYQIVPTDIEVEDIRRILAITKVQPEPVSIPFPQADRFERVIDLLTRLQAAGGTLTQEEITTNYAFDIRQTQYYTSAGRYLGLIETAKETERGVIIYSLTPFGTQLINKAPKARNLSLIESILSHDVFRKTVEYYLNNAKPPSPNEVATIMKAAGLPLSDITGKRRSQSVLGWVRWMMELTTS